MGSHPVSSKKLTFGAQFDKPTDRTSLPVSLEVLRFGDGFNQAIGGVALPESLKMLTVGDGMIVWTHQSTGLRGGCRRRRAECSRRRVGFTMPVSSWPPSVKHNSESETASTSQSLTRRGRLPSRIPRLLGKSMTMCSIKRTIRKITGRPYERRRAGAGSVLGCVVRE